jgi:hypothetical protein
MRTKVLKEVKNLVCVSSKKNWGKNYFFVEVELKSSHCGDLETTRYVLRSSYLIFDVFSRLLM